MSHEVVDEVVDEEGEGEGFLKKEDVVDDKNEMVDNNELSRSKDVVDGDDKDDVNDFITDNMHHKNVDDHAVGNNQNSVVQEESDDVHTKITRSKSEVSGDETDVDSMLHAHSAITLANEYSSLKWKNYDSEMIYTVKYIPSTPEDSLNYMNRFNEGAYEEACGKEFTLMMFPPDNSVIQYFPHLISTHEVLGFTIEPKTDVSFRMEFLYMNHLIKAIRLQKILLLQEYQKLKEKIIKFKDFLVLCNKKKDAQNHRLSILENELVMFEPYSGFNPGSIMGSFLSSGVGWSSFQTLIDKEIKYLQNLAKDEFKAKEKERLEAIKAAKKEARRKKQAEAKLEDNQSDVSSMVSGNRSQQDAAIEKSISEGKGDGSVAGGQSGETETESMIIEKILNRQGLGLSRDEIDNIWWLLRYWQVVNSAAVRAHLGTDAAYRTYSSGVGGNIRRGKSSGAISSKQQELEAYVEEKCPSLPLLLQSGNTGVANWGALCDFLGVKTPSTYRPDTADSTGYSTSGRFATNETKEKEFNSLLQVSEIILELITSKEEEAAEHPHRRFVELITPHVTRVTTSNLAYTVRERDVFAQIDDIKDPNDFNETIDTTKLGKCLLGVADDIGSIIQELIIENFRRLKVWSDVLDNMRRERVKTEGGQIMLRDNQEVEIDEQGAIRVIPNADDIVDTDVLHKAKQRVRVAIAIPQATRELKAMKARKYNLQGELAAVTQLGFTTVAPYAQRAIRGSLIRKKVHRFHRANVVLFAMHAAATTIQSKVRQIIGIRLFTEYATRLRHDAAAKIQAFMRRILARKLYHVMKQLRLKTLMHDGAVAMQKIIRGFLGRCKVRKMLYKAADEKQKANYNWASLTIQKYARRYIAKKAIVRSRHIRNNLSPEVLVLAERYMTKTNGDLWGFLKEVDMTMKRLSKTIEENQQREDTWADTFVQSVLEKRQEEFDSSWSTFADHQQKNKQPTLGPEIKTQCMANTMASTKSRGGKSRGGTAKLSMLDTFDASANLSILNTSNMEEHINGLKVSNPPPGSFMRRVISSTMVQGGRVHAAAIKASTARADANKARIQTIKDAYAPIGKHKQKLKKSRLKDLAPKAGQVQKKERQSVFETTNKFKVTEKKKPGLSQAFLKDDWVKPTSPSKDSSLRRQGSAISFQGDADRRSGLLSPVKGQRSGTLSPIKGCHTSSDGMVKGDAYKGVVVDATALHKQKRHDPGYSLLVDVPMGLNDKMERLLQAAAMRCYVPDLFWKGEDGEPTITHAEAYAMYLDMPEGSLAKLRYEQKVHMWCAGPANRLRLKGFNFIRETLPVSKMRMFLKGVECPRILIDKTIDVAHELQAMDVVPDGLLHKGFKEDLNLIKEGKGTIETAVRAGLEEKREELNETWEEQEKRREQEEAAAIEAARAFEESNKIKTKAQAILEDMITRGKWTDLNSPMDGMLQHAAFLICPHKDNDALVASGLEKGKMEGVFDDPNEAAETEDEKRMGHMAFMSFAQEMLTAPTEKDKKICIRDRYRAAVILSTPFELRLQDLKVFSVRDLVTLSSDGVKGSKAVADCIRSMPKPYRLQLEALLSMVISLHEKSNTLPGAGECNVGTLIRTTAITKDPNPKPSQIVGPLIDNPRLIQAPLVFDKKFQRGPFDPYGRPARMPHQLPSLVQHTASTRKFRLYGNPGSVMHEIGPDNAIAISVAESVRRQQEIKDQLANSGVYIHADVEEMYTALPPNLFEMTKKSQNKVKEILEETEDSSRDLLKDDTYQSLKRDDDITTSMWAFEPDKSLLKKNTNIVNSPSPKKESATSDDMDNDNKAVSNPVLDIDNSPSGRNNTRGSVTFSADTAPHGVADIEEDQSPSKLSHSLRNEAMRQVSSSGQKSAQGKSQSQSRGSSRKSSARELAKKSGVSMTSFGETFDTEHAFDRPYVCKFEGCEQAFSRLYTLKLHEKSHLMFPEYHKYKHDPMLGYDLDREQMEAETRERLLSLENLPSLREQELERTILTSSLDNSSDATHIRAQSKPVSRQEEKLRRQQHRKQVQARMLQEQEQRKLQHSHYR